MGWCGMVSNDGASIYQLTATPRRNQRKEGHLGRPRAAKLALYTGANKKKGVGDAVLATAVRRRHTDKSQHGGVAVIRAAGRRWLAPGRYEGAWDCGWLALQFLRAQRAAVPIVVSWYLDDACDDAGPRMKAK